MRTEGEGEREEELTVLGGEDGEGEGGEVGGHEGSGVVVSGLGGGGGEGVLGHEQSPRRVCQVVNQSGV